MKKLAYIDAMRGLAIIGVLIVHCTISVNNLPSNLHVLFINGEKGVHLFYIISALTLFLSIDSRSESENRLFQNFFIRRFFRIAPMYWVAIALYLIIYGTGANFALANRPSINTLSIIFNVLFLHGCNPYYFNTVVPGGWSVGVEMGFYILVPYLFSQIKDLKKAASFTIATIFLAVVLKQYAQYPIIPEEWLWNDYLLRWLPYQLPIFGMGITMYFILYKSKYISDSVAILKEKSKKNASIMCTFTAFCLMVVFSFGEGFIYLPNNFLYGLAFMILIFAQAMYPLKIVVNRFICYLGKISFSVYLLHLAVLPLAKTITDWLHLESYHILKFAALFAITLLFSSGVSSLTYTYIEQPFQRLGKMIIVRLEDRKVKDGATVTTLD